MKPNQTVWPRITIVMPSFNQATFLEEAICSVLDQTYPNQDFMIMDGGSTDQSREIIQRYESHLTYWRSYPDKGQSAAIDEGMSRATGELAGWLNSDDALLPGALNAIAEASLENPAGGLFAGNLAFMNSIGTITGFLRMPSQAAWFARLGVFAVSGPGSFYRTIDYHKVGGIRRDLHYLMDNELYIRMMLCGVEFVYLDRYLAAFRRHEHQKTTALRHKMQMETRKYNIELQRYGLSYNSLGALLLYYLWQTLNGNYLVKRLHAKRARGQHWRAWADSTPAAQ